MKLVAQLNSDGYFVGYTEADESPLEPGVYLLPARTVDVPVPALQDGYALRWDNGWVFEVLPTPASEPESEPYEPTYADLRAAEYPAMADYLDGIVKGDQAQIDKYIADCLAIKAKYPKPQ